MNVDDKQLLREIESGEAWLASIMREYPAPAPRAAEHLKLSVRIAAAEAAVRMDPAPPPSPQTIRLIKDSIRAELLRSTTRHHQSWWRRKRFAMGSLAAAAALAFLIVPYAFRPAPDGDVTAAASLQVFSDVLAASFTSDFDQQVESVDETLNELSEMLAMPDWLGVDDQIDDLEDDIDSLIEESNTWLNV